MNNRGVPLSAIDLIKNTLMSKCKTKEETVTVYEKWLSILGFLTDSHTIQERFFRQYYNAFVSELYNPKKGITATKAQRGNLIAIYESLINYDYKWLLNDLCEKAEIYSILIGNSENVSKELSLALRDLERIEGTSSYILLLNVLANQKKYKLLDEDIVNLVQFLTKFFVHRNFTNIPATMESIIIFMAVVDEIKNKTGKDVYNAIIHKLTSKLAPNSVFEECIKTDIYANNKDSTRFILCYYEEKFKTKESPSAARNLWERDEKGKYIWTIEHIFPEGKNIPQCWIDMIADGDKDKAQDYYDRYVHTLGNLTVTGYNSTLGNESFEKKRDHQKDGNAVGYKNGLKLNEDLKDESSWTVDKIQTRTNKLAQEIISEFKIEGLN